MSWAQEQAVSAGRMMARKGLGGRSLLLLVLKSGNKFVKPKNW